MKNVNANKQMSKKKLTDVKKKLTNGNTHIHLLKR